MHLCLLCNTQSSRSYIKQHDSIKISCSYISLLCTVIWKCLFFHTPNNKLFGVWKHNHLQIRHKTLHRRQRQSFSRRTRVSGYQNVSILDYIAAKDDGVVVTTEAIKRTKLQSNITTNKLTPSLLQARCPSCHPMHSLRALNEKV